MLCDDGIPVEWYSGKGGNFQPGFFAGSDRRSAVRLANSKACQLKGLPTQRLANSKACQLKLGQNFALTEREDEREQ
jgi:hypothetical protein